MNVKTLFFYLATGSALIAQPATATASVAPSDAPTAPISSATPTGPIAPHDAATPSGAAASDSTVVPNAGFPASRYQALWTKSPFAVATPEAAQETSPDYSLVGVLNLGGILYASVIERQNQEHYLISSDKPNRGLTLTSITRSHDDSDTYASMQKDGQTLTLKLEQAPPSAPLAGAAPGMLPGIPGAAPGAITPNIPMPGANPTFPAPGSIRPFPRIHRPTINLPPRNAPLQQQPPLQIHPPPPPPQ
jgi:hypothetical protein